MSFLTICSVLCPLPAILILLFGTFDRSKKELVDLSVLIFSFVLIDILCYILARAGINNLPFFHLVTLLELVIFSRVYSYHVSGFRKKTVLILGGTGAVALILNTIFLENILDFNSSARVIQAIIILIFAVLWFIEVFINLKENKLTDDPILYVTSGILIYFTGSAVIFGMYNSLLQTDQAFLMELWDIHSVLNILMNLALAVAFYKLRVDYVHQLKD